MTQATKDKILKILKWLGSIVAIATAFVTGMHVTGCAMFDKGAGAVADWADTNKDGVVSAEEASAAGDKVAKIAPVPPGFGWLEAIIGGVATAGVAGAGAYTVARRRREAEPDAKKKS